MEDTLFKTFTGRIRGTPKALLTALILVMVLCAGIALVGTPALASSPATTAITTLSAATPDVNMTDLQQDAQAVSTSSAFIFNSSSKSELRAFDIVAGIASSDKNTGMQSIRAAPATLTATPAMTSARIAPAIATT